MTIAVLSDEISDDLNRSGGLGDLDAALRLAHGAGIRHIELRKIGDKRFPYFDTPTLGLLRRLRDELGLVYTTASPGVFKTATLGSPEMARDRDELFPATLELAAELGIPRLLSFGLARTPVAAGLAGAAEALADLGAMAANYRIDLLIENETGTWADLPEDCLKILKLIGKPNVAMHWDPGNLFRSGGFDYKAGYELLKAHIRNVHVYDVVKNDSAYQFKPLGEGQIDYRGQVADLRRDGYGGTITVEAHCGPRPETFLKSLAHLKALF